MHFSGAFGQIVSCPDDQSGLYIRDGHGVDHRIRFPEDALFFQFGETLQILSGGVLPATLHYVAPIRPARASGVHRVTFALFLNPDVDVTLKTPDDSDCDVHGFRKGETFGQFSLRAFRRYY